VPIDSEDVRQQRHWPARNIVDRSEPSSTRPVVPPLDPDAGRVIPELLHQRHVVVTK
jgi:hypothetical protein